MRRNNVTNFILLTSLTPLGSFAFHLGVRSILHSSSNLFQAQKNNIGDFDDFDFQDDISSSQEMASEFYRQVRLREKQSIKDVPPSTADSQINNTNNEQRSSSKVTRENDPSNNAAGDMYGRKKMRMMGELDSTGTPSAGLFAREYGSVYSFPVERPRGGGMRKEEDTMLRSEFWNVLKLSSNEWTLAIQGILVLGSLMFILYIGLSGGITNGSERFGILAKEFNGLGESLDWSTIVPNGMTDAVVSNNPGIWL